MKKNKNNVILFITTLIFLISFTFQKAFPYTPYSYKITLDEGITFVHHTIKDYNNTSKNQEINYIELDFNNKNINLSLIKANNISSSKDTLLNQLNKEESSNNKNIIGGVNGEFFHLVNGQPLFTTISNNELYSIINSTNEALKRPIFYIDEDRNYSFDFLNVIGNLKFTNSFYPDLKITSINKLDSYNNTNVSNYKINEESTYYPHEGLPSRYMLIDLLNSDGSFFPGFELYGKVSEVGEMTMPKKINKNQLIITSYGDENYNNISYSFLNEIISIKFDIYSLSENSIKNNITTAFTGHEYLIKSGEEMTYDYYKTVAEPNLINNRHARTALGITEDNKVILFTVDDYKDSIGMTLSELSSYLKSLGVVNAINLDGGGSTSISFENDKQKLFLMNQKNKFQRKISNVIAITLSK